MIIGIACYPTVGGSGIIATELGKMLAERGHEIHFITSERPFRLDNNLENIYYHEVKVNDYPVFQYPPYDLSLTAKMAEVIDAENLDILHVHYALPHAMSAILAKDIAERDIKIVTTLHGTDITILGMDPAFKKLIGYAIEKSDAVTAVSQSLREETRELIETNYPISVIHNFLNEAIYYPVEATNLKNDYGITPDEKVLIHISNFRKVKRIEDVIYTFYEVQHEVKSKLLLVGDGPEREPMQKIVKELGIEEKVLFVGKKRNIIDFLSMADILLLLSEKESFGLVILEAMNCGVPAIGTNIGGIPEVISHGENGYLIEKGDVKQAAIYVKELLLDQKKYDSFSQHGLEHVKKHFHSEIIVQAYVDLYKKILD